MRITGHRIRDHIRLLGPLFGLIAAVFALRMIMAAADTPLWITRMVSVTVATSLSVLLAALLFHTRGFGSYPNVVVSSLLLNIWSEVLIVVAIAFATLTKTTNIYTAPEFSIPGDDPLHLKHIYAHLTYGIGTGTLTGAGVGCLVLWLLRRIAPVRSGEGNL